MKINRVSCYCGLVVCLFLSVSVSVSAQVIDSMVRVEKTLIRLDGSDILVPAFSIGNMEISTEEYVRVRGENRFITLSDSNRNKPVVMVRWYDAAAYCMQRSVDEGLDPFYLFMESRIDINVEANGYRLPTRNEYFAVKERNKATLDKIGDYAWIISNSSMEIKNRALKKPDATGLYDIWGNVWEYCNDVYEGETKLSIDLSEPNDQHYRPVFGGCISDEDSVAKDKLVKLTVFNRLPDAGFRIVKNK